MPRFLEALRDGGADAVRLDAYVTQCGCSFEACTAERQLLQDGHIDVILFTSVAEVPIGLERKKNNENVV